MPMHDTVVGFIGLGLMGRPMALNLRKGGFALVVHNRSQAAVDALVAAGARAAPTPAEVAAAADVVITMLPDSPDVQQVLAGDHGVLAGVKRGAVIVDMSTISPAVARELSRLAAGHGAEMLDAPVSGGEIGAIDGTLSIMVGGDAGALERVRPVLERMGRADRIVHIGESGAGQIAKVCNQLVIAATLGGVSEALALATKAGVDAGQVRLALLGGFASSRVLEVHGERILSRNFRPGFRAGLFDKDLRIGRETLEALQVDATIAAAARDLVSALIESGRASDDYSAVAKVVFAKAGLTVE